MATAVGIGKPMAAAPRAPINSENAATENYEYFKSRFDDLYLSYKDKYIALKNSEVIGVYDDFANAVKSTARTEVLGTFIVQHCVKETPDNTSRFYNNNVRFGRLEVV